MSPQVLDAESFSPDILDFIVLLARHDVMYLLVGGEAVIFYGHARLTGDVDVFYDRSEGNVSRLYAALEEFWQGEVPGVDDFSELTREGQIIQFGVPPNRIDLINRVDGVEFSEAWPARTTAEIEAGGEGVPVLYMGLEQLVQNKRAAARPKDVDDLRFLERVLDRERR